MENYFRFLINADQCLNMSSFSMFFYRLESFGHFHESEVQLLGDSTEESLHRAVRDIRMYLDKYPFRVGDFQIILALRRPYPNKYTEWKESLFYSLLHLWFQLQKSNIFIGAKSSMQTKESHVLNMVVLYEGDFTTDMPEPVPYMANRPNGGSQLREDIALMLRQEFGLCREVDENGAPVFCGRQQMIEEMQRALSEQDTKADAAACELLRRYCGHIDRYPLPLDTADEGNAFFLFVDFVKNNLFQNYNVLHTLVDRNNRRNNILAQLRLVDFITSEPTEPNELLHQYCTSRWEQVLADTELESRYSRMLQDYQASLAEACPESTGHSIRALPGIEAILCEKIESEQYPEFRYYDNPDEGTADDRRKGEADINAILDSFLRVRRQLTASELLDAWNGTYRKLKEQIRELELNLQRYASEMGVRYIKDLSARKRNAVWNEHYSAEGSQSRLMDAQAEQTRLLEQLQDPQINPCLRFQDQLNLKNELESIHLDMLHYIRCLQAAKAGCFGVLLLCLLGFGFLHHGLMQPYVFFDTVSLLVYLGYGAACAVLMLLSWSMPKRYFIKKMLARIQDLRGAMEHFLASYYDKGCNFGRYINALNQLDAVTRYLRLLEETQTRADHSAQRRNWHIQQIKHHQCKLEFFQGLINLQEGIDPELTRFTGNDLEKEVIDCPIYWPQGGK